jgi:RNA polymerase sigma-70 factor (ECF subfamily)
MAPPATPGSTLEEDSATIDAIAFVEAFLDGLDDPRREIFVACCIEGMSAVEVSTALAVNLNPVYSRLRSAKSEFDRAVHRRQVGESRRT